MRDRSSSSPDAMMSAVTDSMKTRTGRSLDEWVDWVEGTDLIDHAAAALLRPASRRIASQPCSPSSRGRSTPTDGRTASA